MNFNKPTTYTAYASVATPLKKGNFVIGSISKSSGSFSMTSSPAMHSTLVSAQTEAARLAAIDKTKKFIILEVKAIASLQEVVWE